MRLPSTILIISSMIVTFNLEIANALPILEADHNDGGIFGKNATPYGPQTYGQTYFPPPIGNPSNVATGDQLLFQNLLSAEWIVDGLYSSGLLTFNEIDFITAGYPNDTFSQLQSVYQNENGHLRLFENAIDSTNIKPGKCNYTFGFEEIQNKTLAVKIFMEIVSEIEIGSMAYLTGLARQAKTSTTLKTIMGTISAETRHLTFVNGQLLKIGNFVGPVDTTYPWPLQLLSVIKRFIVNGSCPLTNPEYPSPDQKLPKLLMISEKSNLQKSNGSLTIQFSPTSHDDLPAFNETSIQAKDLHAIFFHSVFNYTVPASFNKQNSSLIEIQMPTLTSLNGNLLVALTNTSNVQQKEDIIAGPLQIELGLS